MSAQMPMKPCETWAHVNKTTGAVIFICDTSCDEDEAEGLLSQGERLARVTITEGWRPIEEAPRDDKPVDVWCVSESRGGFRLPDAVWNEALQAWKGPTGFWSSVTHFMPPPAPPREGK